LPSCLSTIENVHASLLVHRSFWYKPIQGDVYGAKDAYVHFSGCASSYKVWSQLPKKPGEEGARQSVPLSLLVDHSLCVHPDQQTQLKNNLPAYIVGNLQENVQAECLLDVANDLVSSDNPQEKLKRFTRTLHEVFAFGRSKKHMIQRQ
jgi:hypothetical protein